MSEQLPKIVVAAEIPAFSIACYGCDDGDHIGSMEQAVAEGWTSIEFNDGAAWNFLGWCRECRLKDERSASSPAAE